MEFDFLNYIQQNALILIPVLYIIGIFISKAEDVDNKHIPIILLFISIVFSLGYLGISFNSVIQGVLIAGVTVLSHQIVKQHNSKDNNATNIENDKDLKNENDNIKNKSN